MLKSKIVLAVVASLALSACQTTQEYQVKVDASLDQRLAAYHGRTMADFIARTGLVPTDYYPASDGRVFIVQMTPVVLTLPATNVTPAIYRADACQLMLETERVGDGATADNWRVTGTTRRGPCNNLPV